MAKKLIGFYKVDETDKEKSIQEIAKEIAKKMRLEAEKESKFGDISVWIFQCNPEKYNLIGALHDEETKPVLSLNCELTNIDRVLKKGI